MEQEDIDCYHWKVKYNIFEHDKAYGVLNCAIWNDWNSMTDWLHYNKGSKELNSFHEEVRQICNFFGVKALYVKGIVPIGKV